MIAAEFRESIRPAVPQIIAFLRHNEWYLCEAGADVLAKFSEQGKVSNLLIQRL